MFFKWKNEKIGVIDTLFLMGDLIFFKSENMILFRVSTNLHLTTKAGLFRFGEQHSDKCSFAEMEKS